MRKAAKNAANPEDLRDLINQNLKEHSTSKRRLHAQPVSSGKRTASGGSFLEEDEELNRIREEKRKRLMRQTSEPSEKKTENVVALDDSNFDDALKTAGLPVLVDFWAEWCFPCRIMGPAVEDLAHDYAGKAVFAKLNVDKNPESAMRYEVMSIPLFIIFKDGKPVERIVGAVGRGPLEEALKKHL